MRITPEQLRHYNRDGFVVVNDFVDPASCGRLRARAEEMVREFDSSGIISIFS